MEGFFLPEWGRTLVQYAMCWSRSFGKLLLSIKKLIPKPTGKKKSLNVFQNKDQKGRKWRAPRSLHPQEWSWVEDEQRDTSTCQIQTAAQKQSQTQIMWHHSINSRRPDSEPTGPSYTDTKVDPYLISYIITYSIRVTSDCLNEMEKKRWIFYISIVS